MHAQVAQYFIGLTLNPIWSYTVALYFLLLQQYYFAVYDHVILTSCDIAMTSESDVAMTSESDVASASLQINVATTSLWRHKRFQNLVA